MVSDAQEVVLGVSDFVAVLNQTLEYAYPEVTIMGELANLRVSRGRWIYFDLKDEASSVKFFGSVRQLPGPLEDGMLLKVRGAPRLHYQYNFSVNVFSIQPAGEGTIKRAAQLLQAKLAKEGLFDESRKRLLPYPPAHIGLVTSEQSAAYADFIKILGARWQGVRIDLVDVQVQGEAAPEQMIGALAQLNALVEPPEVIVLIRGGGSAEDLAAFNSEALIRAIAASRAPILAAVGHEVDLSLAELAADKRASTPSNAAELLVPDKQYVVTELKSNRKSMEQFIKARIQAAQTNLEGQTDLLADRLKQLIHRSQEELEKNQQLLKALSPEAILKRGYAIVRADDKPLRDPKRLKRGAIVDVQLSKGHFQASVTETK